MSRAEVERQDHWRREVNELRGKAINEESSVTILKSPRIMTGVVKESES